METHYAMHDQPHDNTVLQLAVMGLSLSSGFFFCHNLPRLCTDYIVVIRSSTYQQFLIGPGMFLPAATHCLCVITPTEIRLSVGLRTSHRSLYHGKALSHKLLLRILESVWHLIIRCLIRLDRKYRKWEGICKRSVYLHLEYSRRISHFPSVSYRQGVVGYLQVKLLKVDLDHLRFKHNGASSSSGIQCSWTAFLVNRCCVSNNWCDLTLTSTSWIHPSDYVQLDVWTKLKESPSSYPQNTSGHGDFDL